MNDSGKRSLALALQCLSNVRMTLFEPFPMVDYWASSDSLAWFGSDRSFQFERRHQWFMMIFTVPFTSITHNSFFSLENVTFDTIYHRQTVQWISSTHFSRIECTTNCIKSMPYMNWETLVVLKWILPKTIK